MSQPKSDKNVHTPSSGSACPRRAGTAPSPGSPEEQASQPSSSSVKQIRALLMDDRAQDANFYQSNFTANQREELAAAAQQTLTAEVVLLRTAIKRFYQAVNSNEDKDLVNRLAKSLNLLGLSCTRLGNVIKINQALQGLEQNDWAKGVNAEMQALLAEWDSNQEASHG